MLRAAAGPRRFALLLAIAAGAGALANRVLDSSSTFTAVHASVSPPLRQALSGTAAGLICPASSLFFHLTKVSQDSTKISMSMPTLDEVTTSTNNSMLPINEFPRNQPKGGHERNVVTKSLTRLKTIASAMEVPQLIGREKERSHLTELISNQPSQGLSVISVWGMGGLGKTTLVKDVYQSQNLICMFEKRACVTVMRPFNVVELLRSLIIQLNAESFAKRVAIDFGQTTNMIATMGKEKLTAELVSLLEKNKCLIVLDDLSCTAEWDHIRGTFLKLENACQIIVTTRHEIVARHCSEKPENLYNLKVLEYNDALGLFIKKVFKENVDYMDKHPELYEDAELILKKCYGLPLAIVTIGGFLAKQPKTAIEWRKLNENISAELELNPELEVIRSILGKSYDGLPYHLKSCFLYLSIFPEDHKISRRCLIRRWTAEGYSREIREKSAEEIADSYFMELIERSMILPSQHSIHSRKRIDSCQVHDLMHEISISKSTEENLVFRLEEGCSSNTQGTVRHLAVSSNWRRHKSEFESIVDLSRIRSLTVFGKWRPFFISDKMRLLRVLDLEGTSDLVNHHLQNIGKLLHLKYLSLRDCSSITHLPDSLCNVRQLQTLDITGTKITKLPTTITKLRKLEYLRSGNAGANEVNLHDNIAEAMPKPMQNKLCVSTLISAVVCWHFFAPHDFNDDEGNRNEFLTCTMFCSLVLPAILGVTSPNCVVVPQGISKLKALQTLGIVNLARGKDVLLEIKRLTQLRKLGVAGVNMKNSQEFCSVLADLTSLESLLVQSRGEQGLYGCLDVLSSPPKNMQSLKLYGNLGKLPEWIERLHNLVKLSLRSSRILDQGAAMQVLGKLPNLAILRLQEKSFEGEELCLYFHKEAFTTLITLELVPLENLKSVTFEQGTSPKLELLQFRGSSDEINDGLFSGLASLPSLKEFMLQNNDKYKDEFLKDVKAQLAENPRAPVLKRN